MPVNDYRPTDYKTRAVTTALRHGCTGNVWEMKVEHQWLSMIEDEHKTQEQGNNGLTAYGVTWYALVQLIQHVWDTGEIPRKMIWMVIVLIP